MNPLFRFVAVSCLLTAAQAFAASAFEGKVTLSMSGKGQPQLMDYSIKGHKMRIDMNVGEKEDSDTADKKDKADKSSAKKHGKKTHGSKSEAVSTIMDSDKMEMIMLMSEEKMYMVMPIKQAVHKAAEKQGAANQEVEVTGKSETILGYKCDQILVKDKDKGTVTELWVASDLGMFMGMGSGGGGGMFGGPKSASAEKWEEALKGKGGFPMRVITRDAKGAETFKMEATKIDRGPQPDALFVPPADYEKFQMPDMGGMMNPFK